MINLASNERPRRFRDAIGQETNAKILLSMSMKDAYAKAYLFEGMHGCGKTTLARVTAMSANCQNKLPDGEPCCECATCKKIMAGEEVDVVEIDAASNNSVERARELIEESRFQPLECRTKVYIIDEAHMLTTGAFNALLKLLEEPPEWCMYILCTTAKNKIPSTILSRCATFNFRAVPFEKIAEHLKEVVAKYSCSITDDAAYAIASHSGGSVRDAMRDLEKVLSETMEIGINDVTEALGFEPYEQVFRLITSVADNNAAEIIGTCERYREEGKDMVQVLSDVVSVLTDLVMVTAGGKITGRGEGYMSLLDEIAEEVTLEKALYLSKHFAEIRKMAANVSDSAVITVEMLRTANANEQSMDALEVKVRDLEERLARLEAATTVSSTVSDKFIERADNRPKAEAVKPEPKADNLKSGNAEEKDMATEGTIREDGFSVMSPNSECPFATDTDDEVYWKQVMSIAESISQEEEEETAIEVPEKTEAVSALESEDVFVSKAELIGSSAGEAKEQESIPVTPGEQKPEDAAHGELEQASDCASSLQDITDTGFGGIFDLFGNFGSSKETAKKLTESFEERLEKIKAEDRQAKAVIEAASEVNIYKDCVEVVSIGYMETVTKQALAKYDFVKVVTEQ